MEAHADEQVPVVWRARVLEGDDPDGAGRVRIRLSGDPAKEAWARLALWFRPGTEDEVVVAFEAGDLRRPLVIGALWRSSDSPPGGANDGC